MKYNFANTKRQGDVLFIAVYDAELTDADLVPPVDGRYIIREGEATGHAHAIRATDTVTVKSLAGALFVLVGEKVGVEHEEHEITVLDPGVWYVPQQVEYSPQALRRVAD